MSMQSTWHGEIDVGLKRDAVDLSRELAMRLSIPGTFAEYMPDTKSEDLQVQQSSMERNLLTLSHGPFGLVMLFAELDRDEPGTGWDRRAHDVMVECMGVLGRVGATEAGLLSGLAGLAFAVDAAAGGRERYRTLSATLWATTTKLSAGKIQAVSSGPFIAETYDSVQGLAGILRASLSAAAQNSTERLVADICTAFACRFANSSGKADCHDIWQSPPAHARFREALGFSDLGLAHGIAGPLAALSQAYVSSSRSLVDSRMLTHLGDRLAETAPEAGQAWPAFRLFQPDKVVPSNRNAWCYGSVGVGNALLQADAALGTTRWSAVAARAIFDALDMATGAAEESMTPTLCHGLAGIAQGGLRAARLLKDSEMHAMSIALVARLVSLFDPELPLGYRDYEDIDVPLRVSKSGFLDGTAGIALVLAGIGHTEPPHWDAALLLS